MAKGESRKERNESRDTTIEGSNVETRKNSKESKAESRGNSRGEQRGESRGQSRGDSRGDSRKKEKIESDITEKVLFINRCSKVVSGGRKFSFSALILVGDGKGRVGFGIAKANELTDAIRRGGEIARKNMKTVPMEGTTVPHEISVKWDGASVLIKPAPEGTGVIAGSVVRAIFELAGIKDVMAKSQGSNNPVNKVRATFLALKKMQKREIIKEMRGLA